MAREKQEWLSSCCRDSEDKAQQSEEAQMDTGMRNQLKATCKRVTKKGSARMARYYCISKSTVIHFFTSWSRKRKYFFEEFILYNNIRENNLRAFPAHENIFAPKKGITVW